MEWLERGIEQALGLEATGDLGVAYAESWLACRYIADRYSARRLGRVYAALDRGNSLDEASRSALGVSEQDLVRGWRAYLQRLAERA